MDKPQNPDSPRTRKRRGPKLEMDIFGNEYLGAKTVFTLSLDVDTLSEGAQRFITLASTLQMTSYELARVFSSALLSVAPAFWERKLEELTPFEWKLAEALKDKEFRDQVEALLEAQSTHSGSFLAHHKP